MKRPASPIKRGTEILTHATLGETEGMIVGPANLAERRANARGTIAGIVAGHGGECYWVDHNALPSLHAPLAPYWFEELELFIEPVDLASDEEPVRTPRFPGRRASFLALALTISSFLTVASVGCKAKGPASTHELAAGDAVSTGEGRGPARMTGDGGAAGAPSSGGDGSADGGLASINDSRRTEVRVSGVRRRSL